MGCLEAGFAAAEQVSMLQLIVSPEQHDCERVQLIGFFRHRRLAAGSLTNIAR